MSTKTSFVVLGLIVAAMLVGTTFYTDARDRASQKLYSGERVYCGMMTESHVPMTSSDREICDHQLSRNSVRKDETIALVLYGGTALVALLGILLIMRRRRSVAS